MGRSRTQVIRRFGPSLILWLAVTGGATAISTAGVLRVGSEVTDSHKTLSAATIEELAAAPDRDESPPTTTSATTIAPALPANPRPRPAPTTSTVPASLPAVPSRPEPVAPEPQSATFAGQGGVISVTCRSQQITLDSAHPNDGYRLIVHEDGPERVLVAFSGESHRETLGAMCRDGSPVGRTFEPRHRERTQP